jgi:hypothetical protein
LADCSSEIDIGSVARIQKLPSSSLGMNSPPSSGKSDDAVARIGMRATAPRDFRCLSANAKSGL